MALNLDKIRENAAKAKEEAARRSTNYYEWKDGRNILRILPPWVGADDFSRIFAKHWNLGPEGKTMVYCPKVCFDKPCPICDNIDSMWKSKPDETTKEWLRKVGAGPRFYVNVIDMNDIDTGIQVAEFPKTVLLEVWNIMVDTEVGHGDITHLENGRDIIIDKTGKGLSTRYSVRAKLAASPVPIPVTVADLPNLDMMVRNESYENLKLVWEGKEPLPAPGAAAALPAPPSDVDMVKVGSAYVPPPAVEAATTPVTPAAIATPAPAPATPVAPATPAPAPAAPTPMTLEDQAIAALEAEAAVTPPPATGVPACFGNFDENNATCLDCVEQDDCETKMIEAKRAASKAAAAATAAPAPAAASVTTPAPATASAVSAADLMAEMEAAINR